MAKGMYVGVGNVAKKVKSAYIGVDGVARKIKKAYMGVDGVAKEIYSAEMKETLTASGNGDSIFRFSDIKENQFVKLEISGTVIIGGKTYTVNRTYDAYEIERETVLDVSASQVYIIINSGRVSYASSGGGGGYVYQVRMESFNYNGSFNNNVTFKNINCTLTYTP